MAFASWCARWSTPIWTRFPARPAFAGIRVKGLSRKREESGMVSDPPISSQTKRCVL